MKQDKKINGNWSHKKEARNCRRKPHGHGTKGKVSGEEGNPDCVRLEGEVEKKGKKGNPKEKFN